MMHCQCASGGGKQKVRSGWCGEAIIAGRTVAAAASPRSEKPPLINPSQQRASREGGGASLLFA